MFLSFLAGNHGCVTAPIMWNQEFEVVMLSQFCLFSILWFLQIQNAWPIACIKKTLCWLPDSLVFDCIISSPSVFLLSQLSDLSYCKRFGQTSLAEKKSRLIFFFPIFHILKPGQQTLKKWQVVWTMPLSTLKLNPTYAICKRPATVGAAVVPNGGIGISPAKLQNISLMKNSDWKPPVWLLSGSDTKFDMDISSSKSQVTFTNTYIADTPPPANWEPLRQSTSWEKHCNHIWHGWFLINLTFWLPNAKKQWILWGA